MAAGQLGDVAQPHRSGRRGLAWRQPPERLRLRVPGRAVEEVALHRTDPLLTGKEKQNRERGEGGKSGSA